MATTYKIAFVEWQNNDDFAIVYDKRTFRRMMSAIRYVELHRKRFLRKEKEYLNDLIAIDIYVECWNGESCEGAIYSICLWEK